MIPFWKSLLVKGSRLLGGCLGVTLVFTALVVAMPLFFLVSIVVGLFCGGLWLLVKSE